MDPHLTEDTDDDCDDPIRLFDNNLRAVYFGSKPIGQSSTFRDAESRWRLEAKRSVEFCHPVENSTLGKPDSSQVEEIQSGITSECDITPLCVKLVDCGKFPWYFRKYTQQIMNKINSNQHSDSDKDVDVEGILDDSDDCFIIEDLEDATNKIVTNDQLCIKTVKSPGPIVPKNKLNRTVEKNVKSLKDDEEIQRALSVKHLVHVDLKRNQGLIGLKIVHKVETNETLDIKAEIKNVVEKEEVKEQSMMGNDKYVSAVDKTLSHIGTQLIPIEEKESNSICQFTITNEEKDLVRKPTIVKSPSSQNITVQFDISKIPEKLIDNLITKKRNDQLSEAKVISQSNKSPLKHPENKIETEYEKELNSKVTLTDKIENSSTKVKSHVKNVKNTNKYKNDQNKIHGISHHSSLVGIIVSNKSKQGIKEIKCKTPKGHKDGTQSINMKLVKKPRKKIKKQKAEIKSPILQCSTVPKKPKYEMPPICNESVINTTLPKDLSNLIKIVDKLTNSKTCDLVQDTNRPKPIIFPRPAPKPFDFLSREAIRREPNVIPNKTKSQSRIINSKSLNVSKQPKSCNDVKQIDFKTNNLCHGQFMTLNQNTTLNEKNILRKTPQNNVTKRTKNTVAVTNPTPKVPIKNNRPTVCNINIPTTTVAVPASRSESVPFIQNSNLSTTHGPHLPIHNTVHNKMNTSNIPQKPVNTPVQNHYASAIILKSNNHTNLPFAKYCVPPVQTVAPQRPMSFLNVSDSINSRAPPPYPIFYRPDPSVIHQGCPPGSVNFVPNQFYSLRGPIGQQPSNAMQDLYRECWLPQNMTPPPPPPIPVPPPQIPVPPPNVPLRNSHDVNQSDNCSNRPSASVVQNPQSVNTLQANNSSIIGINNDGLVKKINIAAMPVQNHANNTKGTIKVEQVKDPQIMSPVEDTIVATKNEMFKELDKLSFVDGNSFKEVYPASIINEIKKENTLDVATMAKPGRFGSLKLTMDSKGKLVETPLKGYSPPILPIPTYQKVLLGVNLNPPTKARPKIDPPRPGEPKANSKIETKPMRIRDFVKGCKRKFNNAWNNDEDSKRKEEAKKISLEEYKKRLMKNYSKFESNKNTFKEKFNNRKNVDYSTETDLGYDSDSTVVL